MTISHHPPGDLLAHYAAGALSEAEHLVVAVHVAGCARCQRFVRTMEELAGMALIDATAPESPGAFAAIMAEINRRPRAEPPREQAARSDPALAELPEPLQRCEIGGWRWVAPGLTTRPILLTPDGSKRRAFLLHGEPGTRLIQHTHTGDELTCVLKGSYTDHTHRFETGDLDFSDEEVEHELVVTDDGPCLCLIAMTGDLKLSGMLGRLISPFIRL